MNIPTKAMLVGVLAAALATQAFAYTISGVIPPGTTPVRINLHPPIRLGQLKFTFSAPRSNAGVAYALNFCIGLAVNPCGQPQSHVINVPEGQTRSASFNSSVFLRNVLVVQQGTKAPVPYSVQVN